MNKYKSPIQQERYSSKKFQKKSPVKEELPVSKNSESPVLPPFQDMDMEMNLLHINSMRFADFPHGSSSTSVSEVATGPGVIDPFQDPAFDLANISDATQYNSQSDEDRLFFPME